VHNNNVILRPALSAEESAFKGRSFASLRTTRVLLILVLSALLFLLFAAPALAQETLPGPRGYVNDFAGVIGPAESSELEGFLRGLETRTTAEVAVATVPDLDGFADVDEYAVKLFEKWKIGKKGQDNGVLVLLAMKEHRVRIEIGYGLEGAITDGTAGEIIRQQMAPLFRQGEYGKGLVAGVHALAEKIPPGGVMRAQKKKGRISLSLVLLAVFLLLIFGQFLFPGPRFTGRGRRGMYMGGPFIGGFGGGFGGGGFGGGGGGFGGGFGGFGGGGSGGGGASGGW
jgi:uncharacterized protein